jgi:peptidoglycan/LPS O-acetylase OafA/YrhL
MGLGIIRSISGILLSSALAGTLAARWLDIRDQDAVSLAMISVTVLIAIAYARWIDAPFERWRQRRATKGKQERTSDLYFNPNKPQFLCS